MADGSITRWIGRLKVGDPAAAERLWEAYYRRVVALARDRLRHAPRRAADEEDVALSAFDSFFARAAEGRFPRLTDRQNLWPLLVTITANKCVDLVRKETRRKRSGAGPDDPTVVGGDPFADVVSREPSPEFALELADELEHRLALLDRENDPDLRPIALAKMEGATTTEIAERVSCSRRSVERKIGLIARLWTEGDDA